MQEKIENGLICLKTHVLFSVHATPETLKMEQSSIILDLFEKNSGTEIT